MQNSALLIGNTDGIGLALTRRLLEEGWRVQGISRRGSDFAHPAYRHVVLDVRADDYTDTLGQALAEEASFDLCVYGAGIGELLDFDNMETEVDTVEVNLMGMIKTVSLVIPSMLKHGKGHFIGISSFADELLSAEAPSYHASKAGFSSYLGGLALALKKEPVHVTNVRFGFVDTKMAKGDVKPFMMSVERAVQHLMTCMEKKPARYTAPRIAIPFVKFRKFIFNLKILFYTKGY